MAFYESLLKEDLGLSDQFMESHKEEIQEVFRSAVSKLGEENGTIALHHILHLGCSIVLRQSNVNEALAKIRQKGFPNGTDETTVITIAAVHHMLDWIQNTNPDSQAGKDAQEIRALFAGNKWLVGDEVTKVLEFPTQQQHASEAGNEIARLLQSGPRRPGERNIGPGGDLPG